MKKKIDKIKSKKFYKNVVYVTVLLAMVLASLMSVLQFTKTIESSADEGDTQKIFSVDNDTLSDELKEDGDKEAKDGVSDREVISFIRQDEQEEKSKKETSNEEVESKEVKKETSNEEVESKEAKKEISSEEVNSKEAKKEISEKEANTEVSKKEEVTKEVFLSGNTSCIVPLNGDIIKDFSGDKLVYFKSTDEWRVHKGIDIKASVGAPVKAVLDGYIDKIENDANGMTVVIKHSKKEKSVYKNLTNQSLVMPNQIIKQGDVIGTVGDAVGCGGGSHLHFEIIKGDRFVNPKNYIQFNTK